MKSFNEIRRFEEVEREDRVDTMEEEVWTETGRAVSHTKGVGDVSMDLRR
jgi:hypothetical protein